MANRGTVVNYCFCLPTFVLLITGFVFLNIARPIAQKAKADVVSNFDSWKDDAMFFLTGSENLGPFLGVEGAYLARWQGEWPGLMGIKDCSCIEWGVQYNQETESYRSVSKKSVRSIQYTHQ